MFCRNCGRELTGDTEICAECGVEPMSGTSFCPNCGIPTTSLTEICPQCGAWVGRGAEKELGGDWMPLIAGVLDLIAGVPALILGILVAAAVEVEEPPMLVTAFGFETLWGMLSLLAVPLIIAGVIAIAGGLAALKKKAWWLALGGSIFAFFCAWFVGIPAFVFTLMGRKRFA